MIGIRPFLEGFLAARVIVELFFAGILITGIYALSKDRRPLYIALSLITVYAMTKIALYFTEFKPLLFLSYGISGLFLLQMLIMIARHIRTETEVTADLIMGAACGYLLLGLVWAYGYNFLALIQPNAFDGAENPHQQIWPYIYYSFVTLTTLGYGDITAATDQARALSILEAIFGQLYLAILIARLVGLHAAQINENQHPR